MKNIPEKIRRFLSGNVETQAGAAVCLILNLTTLYVPAIALERIYFGDSEDSFIGKLCLLAFFICTIAKLHALYGFIRIVVWCWAAVCVSTMTNWPLWIIIPFYIFMVLGILRVAIVWWSDDDQVTEKGKT